MRTRIDRILERVEKIPECGCWIYMGSLNNSGYGPHRKVYWALRGEIPPGLELDHKCRVRECCNPDHLRIVTRRENIHAAGSQCFVKAKAEQTHCIAGHEFTPDNIYIRPNGTRACRKCLERRSTDGYQRHRKQRIARQTRYYAAHRNERIEYERKRRLRIKAAALCLILLLVPVISQAQVPAQLPFNDAYWNRIREYVYHAFKQDQYVAIILTESWGVKHARWGDWQIPWTQEAIDAYGVRPHPEIEAFIRKAVNETCQFGNVVYITGNEEGQIPATREFYEWMVSVVRDEERNPDCAGMVHLIGTGLEQFWDGPFDFIVTHQRAPISGPYRGKWLLDSEHNPEYSPEQEASYFAQAREGGVAWAAWRGEANDADWTRRLELFKAVVDGTSPVGCFPPSEDDPLWVAPPTPDGGMSTSIRVAVESAKIAVGEHCGTDHAGSLGTLDAVAANLRDQSLCAGRMNDSVFVKDGDKWKELHLVSFASGCYSTDPAQVPKNTWTYSGTNPNPSGCPDPLPDKSKLVWRLNCGFWCDATPVLASSCEYCTAIGMGEINGTPRCDCPARSECPGFQCESRLTCERYLIEAPSPVFRTDGTLVMDPNSAWRARQTGGSYIEVCNGPKTNCTRVNQ